MINIYDYETLGTKPHSAVILGCAAISVDETRFSSDDPYTFYEMVELAQFIKLDVTDQVNNYGRTVSKDTLEWWSKQSAEAKMIMNPDAELDQPLTALIPWLKSVLVPNAFVYTRGNTFDPVFTTSICELFETEEPYKFWEVRDTRTFIEGAFLQFNSEGFRNNFTPKHLVNDFIPHDPSHDIAMDAYRLQFVTRVAQGLSQEGVD